MRGSHLFVLNSNSYRHVFTGAKRTEPKEALGGILADDMGLGKSLVILSTIAKSMEQALSFASVNKASPPRESLKGPPSKATLVVVPSSREYTELLL